MSNLPLQEPGGEASALVLSDRERQVIQTFLTNPLDLPSEFRSWLVGQIQSEMPTAAALQKYGIPVGCFMIVPDDLTAQTGVYEFTDGNGNKWLYCNGAAASQTTYAALYAAWGPNKYGADSGGNFLLPDTRGRSVWLAGTNAATDVGDADAIAESSRTPSHSHTGPSHGHSFSASATSGTNSNTVGVGDAGGSVTVAHQSHTHSVSVSGTTGAGGTGATSSDAVAHIVIGSMVVRF